MANVNELTESKEKNQAVRKDLAQAKKLYKSQEYEKALEIYETHYVENPELLNEWDRIFYSWSIYQLHIKNYSSDTELFEYAEEITDLIPQGDLNKTKVCAYTFTVFKVLDCLKDNGDWEYMIYWLDKLNPDLLDEKQGQGNDIVFYSNREKYFNFASKAYLECGDYQECIDISKRALESVTKFANSSDVWYNWRIAKSLKELGQNEEALTYLEEVSKVKRDWFVQKEIAENYYVLNDTENAKKHITNAVLTNDPDMIKVNLYHLAYNVLKDDDEELALLHAKYFTAIKLEGDARIPEDIEDLMIDEDELNINSLKHEIKDYWSSYKFHGQDLKYGTITKVFDHGGAGFITSDDDESLFFKAFEFKEKRDFMKVGKYVCFYTQKGFDKAKNRESMNAVNIKLAE